MESPKRKLQKNNSRLRYKIIRKIKDRRKTELQKQSKIAEKELKRRIKFTPRKFYMGTDPDQNQEDYSDFSPESKMLLQAYDQDRKNFEKYGIISDHFGSTQKYIKKQNKRFDKAEKIFSSASRAINTMDSSNTIHQLESEVNQAINDQDQQRLATIQQYKNMVNATLTFLELTSSAGLLGKAYGNYKNWATSANKYKRDIMNLLTKNEKLLAGAGIVADAGQLITEDNPTDQIINKIELPASTMGYIGATDYFRNTSLYNNFGPRIDIGLDAIGVGQAIFDIGRFGYRNIVSPIIKNTYNKNK